MLCGKHARGGRVADDYIYVAMNMHWEDHVFELPGLPLGLAWHGFANTAAPSPGDICRPGDERCLADPCRQLVQSRSVVILVGKSS
jgi:glycogen operon protein